MSSRRPRGSRSVVGSSRASSRASQASRPARQTRRFSPRLRWCGRRSSKPARPTCCEGPARRGRPARRRRDRAGCGPKATSSHTVGQKSWSSGSWKSSPTSARIAVELRRRDGRAEDADRGRRGGPLGQQAVQVQQQRGLAGAVGPDEPDALARRRRRSSRPAGPRCRRGSGSRGRRPRGRSRLPPPRAHGGVDALGPLASCARTAAAMMPADERQAGGAPPRAACGCGARADMRADSSSSRKR